MRNSFLTALLQDIEMLRSHLHTMIDSDEEPHPEHIAHVRERIQTIIAEYQQHIQMNHQTPSSSRLRQ